MELLLVSYNIHMHIHICIISEKHRNMRVERAHLRKDFAPDSLSQSPNLKLYGFSG